MATTAAWLSVLEISLDSALSESPRRNIQWPTINDERPQGSKCREQKIQPAGKILRRHNQADDDVALGWEVVEVAGVDVDSFGGE